VRGIALARDQQGVGLHAFFGQHGHKPLGYDGGDSLAQANVGEQLLARAAAGEAQELLPDCVVLFVVGRQPLHAF
jgi:hypothetical protein